MTSSSDRSRYQQWGWKATSMLAGIAGTVISRSLLERLWGAVVRAEQEPPLNPADRRVSWAQALTWTVGAGVGVGVARLVSQRLAATGWEAATGSPPPGIETD
jgi:hypothetical protein